MSTRPPSREAAPPQSGWEGPARRRATATGRRTVTAARRPLLSRLTAGGPVGNERLTVMTGVLLFVLLAVLGVTIVRIGQLLWLHLFLGLLLIGPVALKLASTGYRFARYYTGASSYRRKGPPPAFLRLMGPVIVALTLTVFASGVALLLIGPSSRGSLLLIHKASFIAWLAVTALHVLGHVPELERALLKPAQASRLRSQVLGVVGGEDGSDHGGLRGPGGGGRALSLTLAIGAGLILAIALIPHFGAWEGFHHFHHDR
jgi:hypothetical protein